MVISTDALIGFGDFSSSDVQPFLITLKPKYKGAIIDLGAVSPENLNIAIDLGEEGVKSFLCIVSDDVGTDGKDDLLSLWDVGYFLWIRCHTLGLFEFKVDSIEEFVFKIAFETELN
jgi:hypothetical protein